MPDEKEEVFIVSPSAEHTHTVIFLHDRDSHGEALYEEMKEWQTSTGERLFDVIPFANCKWIFPTAAHRSWTSIGLPPAFEGRMYDIVGLRSNVIRLRDMVKQAEEKDGIEEDHIIFGGVGQGCAAASQILLTTQNAMAGFIGISGWIPYLDDQLKHVEESKHHKTIEPFYHIMYSPWPYFGRHENAWSTPVFVSHSEDDEVVNFEEGEKCAQTYHRLGYKVTYYIHSDRGHRPYSSGSCDGLASFFASILAPGVSADPVTDRDGDDLSESDQKPAEQVPEDASETADSGVDEIQR